MKKNLITILGTIFIFTLFCFSCQMDHGLEPIRSGISGTIHYIGEWPENTAEIRIVATKTFPPNDVNDLIIGDVLPLSGDSTKYFFYLEPGDYYLGLVWRGHDTAWGIQSIFGIYFEPDQPFSPGQINVPDASIMVDEKNIEADFSKAKAVSASKITGTLRFSGAWPDSVEDVRVIASLEFPPTSLLDLSFSNGIPAYVDSASYYIPVSPGIYKAVGVVIKQKNQPWSVNNIVALYLKENSFLWQEVVVPTEESQIEEVDIDVVFRGNL